jgi:hypothetical protein
MVGGSIRSSLESPEFLSGEIVRAIHAHQLATFGGLDGVRDEAALASALNAPLMQFLSATFLSTPPR